MTVTLTVFVVVGVPDSLPAEDSDRPAGNVPLLNVYGVAGLPLAVKRLLVALYVWFETPKGRAEPFTEIRDTVIAGQVMVRLYVWVAVHAVAVSVAWTVKLNVPPAAGVPESTPADDSVSPVGKVPLDLINVYEPLPPLAVNVWLYTVPAVPPVNTVGFAPFGDTVIVWQLIVIEYACVAGQPLASFARIVKFAVPMPVGVPEIRPLDELSDRPPGKLPLLTLYV